MIRSKFLGPAYYRMQTGGATYSGFSSVCFVIKNVFALILLLYFKRCIVSMKFGTYFVPGKHTKLHLTS